MCDVVSPTPISIKMLRPADLENMEGKLISRCVDIVALDNLIYQILY